MGLSCFNRLLTDKFEAKLDKRKFIGYPKETIRYYFNQPSNRKVFVAR